MKNFIVGAALVSLLAKLLLVLRSARISGYKEQRILRMFVIAVYTFVCTFLYVVLLAGCDNDAINTQTATDNAEFHIDKLFTQDGLTMFRFRDGSRTVYFSEPATIITWHRVESCGKGCTRLTQGETVAPAKQPEKDK